MTTIKPLPITNNDFAQYYFYIVLFLHCIISLKPFFKISNYREIEVPTFNMECQTLKKELIKRNKLSPSNSGILVTSSLSVRAATAHTNGLSTNVPKRLTFLPLAFPTINASVTVSARSTSPE